MRELLYLSERKLRAFHPERKRRWWSGLRGDVGVPGVAQVGMELPAARQDRPDLAEVIDHLHSDLRWYSEEGLRPGQWVQFDTELAHPIVTAPQMEPVLLFIEPGETAGARLLLHGSPEHLLGGAGATTPSLPMYGSSLHAVIHVFESLAAADEEGTIADGYAGGIARLFQYLDRRVDHRAATRLAGYARITVDAAEYGVVVASPLFVEYARG